MNHLKLILLFYLCVSSNIFSAQSAKEHFEDGNLNKALIEYKVEKPLNHLQIARSYALLEQKDSAFHYFILGN